MEIGLALSGNCIANVANAGVIYWADSQSGTSSVPNGPITEILGEFETKKSPYTGAISIKNIIDC
jgi:hypothetical protein